MIYVQHDILAIQYNKRFLFYVSLPKEDKVARIHPVD